MKISTSKKILIWYMVMSLILTSIVIIAAFLKRAENRMEYEKANNYITIGDYQGAIELFDQLDTYKDSKEKIFESKYNLALNYYNNEDYENAKDIFTELGDYLDSQVYLAQINVKLLEQSQELIYEKALSYYESKKYQEALDLYETIIDYKDSNNFVVDCNKYLNRLQNSHTLAAGLRNSLVVTADGTIKTAGKNGYGQLNVETWKNIISVDIYGTLAIGLQENGVAQIAGTYNKKEISNLAIWNDLIDIAAGEQFVVGLKSDGTVIADGHNGDGQIEVNDWKNVTAIDAGSRFTVALTEDKRLLFTGFDNGQIEDFEVHKDEWQDVINISASGGEKNGRGSGHTVGLKSDSTLVAVGDNTYGQCDFSDTKKWSDIVKVATGDWYTVGLKSDGTVVMTGENYPRCKYIDEDILNKYDNIVDIAAGYGQTMLLTDEGEIICFGFDDEGKDQLNNFKKAMIPQY